LNRRQSGEAIAKNTSRFGLGAASAPLLRLESGYQKFEFGLPGWCQHQDLPAQLVADLSFEPTTEDLYGIDLITDQIITIDPHTGAGTVAARSKLGSWIAIEFAQCLRRARSCADRTEHDGV
jgi:hypothetical protein